MLARNARHGYFRHGGTLPFFSPLFRTRRRDAANVFDANACAFAFGERGGKRKPRARTPLYFLPDAERSGASATCVRINSRGRSPCKSRRPGPCAAFKPGIKSLLGTRELYSAELLEAEARTGSR